MKRWTTINGFMEWLTPVQVLQLCENNEKLSDLTIISSVFCYRNQQCTYAVHKLCFKSHYTNVRIIIIIIIIQTLQHSASDS